jgi:hypothetical protein
MRLVHLREWLDRICRLKTRDSQIHFVRLNGVRIASCAWNGYKEKGRGMVYVLSDLGNELLKQATFDFMAEIDASKLMKPWYGTKESRIVAGYDPQKDVVICFVRNAGGDRSKLDCYKLQTNPAPPIAAEGPDG